MEMRWQVRHAFPEVDEVLTGNIICCKQVQDGEPHERRQEDVIDVAVSGADDKMCSPADILTKPGSLSLCRNPTASSFRYSKIAVTRSHRRDGPVKLPCQRTHQFTYGVQPLINGLIGIRVPQGVVLLCSG